MKDFKETPIFFSIVPDFNKRIIEYLLSKGADINKRNHKDLIYINLIEKIRNNSTL